MKRVFLHIGSHKTGTSSIQEALLSQQSVLHLQDFHYFDIKGPSGKPGHPNDWVMTENVHAGNAYVLEADKLRKHFDKIPQNNIIFSSEMMSWLFRESRIVHLKQVLAGYDVKIIVYIRRQDKHIISHHQQGSKGASPALNYFSCSPTALPSQGFRRYLNYYERLGMWADVFDQENMLIRVFEPDMLVQGDTVSDFCHQLGIHSVSGVRVNVSNGFEKTKVGHLINKVLPSGELSRLLRHDLCNEGKLLPSKAEAKMFYQRYIENNMKLNARFNISTQFDDVFNADFSCYPEQSGDHWNEEKANQAIERLLTALLPLANSKLVKLWLKLHRRLQR